MSAAATVTALPDWSERNRRWLPEAIDALRTRIEAGGMDRAVAIEPPAGFVPALTQAVRLFGLSNFEGELLLLLAGIELDQRLAAAVAARADNGGVDYALALDLLAEPHWDALSPDAPLRHWRLVVPERGAAIGAAPLALDERMLHFVTGVRASDPVLAPLMVPVAATSLPGGDVDDIVHAIGAGLATGGLVLLRRGEHPLGLGRELALAGVAEVARTALWIDTRDLPGEAEALHTLALHLDREAALAGAVPILAVEPGNAVVARAFASRLTGRLIWLGPDEPAFAASPRPRQILRFDVPAPDARRTPAALRRRWQRAGSADPALFDAFDRAGRQFHLGPAAIDAVIEQVQATPPPTRAAVVWSAARDRARAGLEGIAQRIEARARFDDLVLPPGQSAMVRDIARQLRQRERVYDEWGFGAQSGRGQGLVALFTGESGTGKTLAAEAIAGAAELDLYRVDLAGLVSKYIGETEKNLKRLFDGAEASGAVLLFDEADALFGKRSEVKDSHDRYANIEVAYLLQRVEDYRGLAILTSNMKSAIDRAFLRRIRFVLTFPMPDTAAREAIWRRQLPEAAPVGEIDYAALARLNLSGGNIRSIAVSAAFKAADAGVPIDQALLWTAAREEFAKLERPFSEGVRL